MHSRWVDVMTPVHLSATCAPRARAGERAEFARGQQFIRELTTKGRGGKMKREDRARKDM